ncbi:MAG: hypothetical protein A3I05_04505 [Deltaproteobacteria bacterium RIFCSPLOWO2_02_FULL_44_10]|nr:MAG: hypothetical protein A3C46_07310 [Deltaproteobacteria bacterium RIFCSPHIGHO2_02_FULL_44_16]OGQ46619.1 MAG: hypothetical protein A3I05_04505 [Deltaproteobacteria bacterium RIFCSPLOWO2_02_FULL_44_10]
MANNLWAPWRMQFIEDTRGKEKEEGCVFCHLLQEPGNDRDKLILWRGQRTLVVMNKYPYTNGHLLVMPLRHVGELHLLTRDEQADMVHAMGEAIQILRETLKTEGINCGLNLGKPAGAGVLGHVHIHIVPRWVGDTNFLPIISDTRTLPEYLQTTYDRLVANFQKLTL